MHTDIRDAHIPTWLKIKMLEAAAAKVEIAESWLGVGYHLGRYHLDAFSEDGDVDFEQQDVLSEPTRILRKIFKSEEHPRGELTDLIPVNYRRPFLLGLLAGAAEETRDEGGGWLAVAEGLGVFLESDDRKERETEEAASEREEAD